MKNLINKIADKNILELTSPVTWVLIVLGISFYFLMLIFKRPIVFIYDLYWLFFQLKKENYRFHKELVTNYNRLSDKQKKKWVNKKAYEISKEKIK